MPIVRLVDMSIRKFKCPCSIPVLDHPRSNVPLAIDDAALLTTQLFSPTRIIMIDLDGPRTAVARRFGAHDTIKSGTRDAAAALIEMTGALR